MNRKITKQEEFLQKIKEFRLLDDDFMSKVFEDEEHIIYVNGAYRDDSPLGLLMHDFSCTNPKDMNYKILADKTRYFKEDEKGVAAMCKIMEDLIDDEKKEIALRLLKQGKLSNEEIAEGLGLDIEVVEALSEK